jgi:RES domain
VLYAARQRTACFAETLAAFRPSLELLAETSDPGDIAGVVSAGFLRARGTATFRLNRGRWLDVRRVATLEALRSAFGPQLHDFGLVDVDLGGMCGPERAFTQAVAAWAYEHGYQGIVYASRFGISFECWAIFDSASITQ